jgi:hypothetical protein
MALQSNANLRLLNGLLSVSSGFWRMQMCVCIVNIYLYFQQLYTSSLPPITSVTGIYQSHSSWICYWNGRRMSVLLYTYPSFIVYVVLLNSDSHWLFSDSTLDQGSSISYLELLESDEEVSASGGVDLRREWKVTSAIYSEGCITKYKLKIWAT